MYHVTARGNERRDIFFDDDDRRTFLRTLEEAVETYGIVLHGYCLMPNHYHLLMETPRANLSQTMGWLQTTYTVRFNRRYRRSGHLFQGRFKAHLVEADSYAMELLRYLHLNPVRPRDKTTPVQKERRSDLECYEWSSHQSYVGTKVEPSWLSTNWLTYFGRSKVKAQRDYKAFVEAAFGGVLESPWDDLHRGLVLGGKDLKDRIRNILEGSSKVEEMAWVRQTENRTDQITAANKLAEAENERRWKAWLRVRLGGERRIDVARALGYKEGSAITHALKRLEEMILKDPSFSSYASTLETEFKKANSSFKR